MKSAFLPSLPGVFDPKAVVLARKAGGFVFRLEGDVVEVAEQGVGVGWLHRQLVMGALPVLDLRAVAALALLLFDHFGPPPPPRRQGNG